MYTLGSVSGRACLTAQRRRPLLGVPRKQCCRWQAAAAAQCRHSAPPSHGAAARQQLPAQPAGARASSCVTARQASAVCWSGGHACAWSGLGRASLCPSPTSPRWPPLCPSAACRCSVHRIRQHSVYPAKVLNPAEGKEVCDVNTHISKVHHRVLLKPAVFVHNTL